MRAGRGRVMIRVGPKYARLARKPNMKRVRSAHKRLLAHDHFYKMVTQWSHSKHKYAKVQGRSTCRARTTNSHITIISRTFQPSHPDHAALQPVPKLYPPFPPSPHGAGWLQQTSAVEMPRAPGKTTSRLHCCCLGCQAPDTPLLVPFGMYSPPTPPLPTAHSAAHAIVRYSCPHCKSAHRQRRTQITTRKLAATATRAHKQHNPGAAVLFAQTTQASSCRTAVYSKGYRTGMSALQQAKPGKVQKGCCT